MSLINKMLRDLDARRAFPVERTGLSSHVRPLPADVPPLWRRMALPLSAAAVGALLVWLPQVLLHRDDARKPAGPAPQARPAPAQTAIAPPPVFAQAPPPVAASAPPPPVTPPSPAVKPPAAAVVEPSSTAAVAAPAPAKPALRPPSAGKANGRPQPSPGENKTTPADLWSSTAMQIDKRAPDAGAAAEADAAYQRAMGALKRDQPGEALSGLRQAVQQDPKHANARQALLGVLVGQKQWSEAQAVSAAGLAVDPSRVGWAILLARLQVEQDDVARAADTLAKHARYAQDQPDYLAFQGLLETKLKRSAAAVANYRAALTLRPHEGRWWYGLGLALEADNQLQDARGAFLKARETGNLPPDVAAAVQQKLR